jgi:hypothetical protein
MVGGMASSEDDRVNVAKDSPIAEGPVLFLPDHL